MLSHEMKKGLTDVLKMSIKAHETMTIYTEAEVTLVKSDKIVSTELKKCDFLICNILC